MDWFEGGIPAAIQQAKTKGVIFLVYITGVDDLSKKMDETWTNSAVATICKTNCVAIKLQAKSTECTQFSQIYPVFCVPSTFLIGTDGVPVEILGGHHEAEDFLNKLTQVFQKTKTPTTVTTGASAQETKSNETSPVSENSDPSPSIGSASAEGVSEQSGTVTEKNAAEGSSTASGTANQEVEIQVKVQKAQELIAKKREEKAKEAQEKAKQEEIQRRNMAKDAAKLKQWQEEKEQEETMKTWRKEKEEAKQARERVKEQIARDRAERNARFNQEKEEREEQKQQKRREGEEKEAREKAKTEAGKRETSRLQFRLPDGSHITETFASSETLGTARVFLNAKIGDAYGNYNLRTTYPKREFTNNDLSSTLLDLELAPSAALVVIPGSKMTSSFRGGDSRSQETGGGILMLVLSPLILLWNFIYNLIFGASAASPQSNIPKPEAETESSPDTSAPKPSPTENAEGQDSTLRNRSKVLKSGLDSRQEGNIRRFTANQDGDEDMTVYNGNSTQQM